MSSAAPVTQFTPFEQPGEGQNSYEYDVGVASSSDDDAELHGGSASATVVPGDSLQQKSHEVRYQAKVKTERQRMTAVLISQVVLWTIGASAVLSHSLMSLAFPRLLAEPVQASWLGWNIVYHTLDRGPMFDLDNPARAASFQWLPYLWTAASLCMLGWRWHRIVIRDKMLPEAKWCSRTSAPAWTLKCTHAASVTALLAFFLPIVLRHSAGAGAGGEVVHPFSRDLLNGSKVDTTHGHNPWGDAGIDHSWFRHDCAVGPLFSQIPSFSGMRATEGNRAEGCRQRLVWALGDRPEHVIRGSFPDRGTRVAPLARQNGTVWLWSEPVGQQLGCPGLGRDDELLDQQGGEEGATAPVSFRTRPQRDCSGTAGYTVSNWVTSGPDGGCQPSRWLGYYDVLGVQDPGHREQWFCDVGLRQEVTSEGERRAAALTATGRRAVGPSYYAWVDYSTVGMERRLEGPCFDPERDPGQLQGLEAGTFWSDVQSGGGGTVRLRIDEVEERTGRALLGAEWRGYREVGECGELQVACANATGNVGGVGQPWQVQRAVSFSGCSALLGPARTPVEDLQQWRKYLARLQRTAVVVGVVAAIDVLVSAMESALGPLLC